MKNLVDRINKAAEIINKAARRSTGSYIVVSPMISNKLDEMMKREQLKKERIEKLKKLNELDW